MDMEAMKAKLEKLAKRKCWSDDEEGLESYFNGNQDDAYAGGQEDGEALLARELLKEFFGA